MANTINIPKAHLVMALCLPLAVLLGYLLAEPLDSGSMAVVVLVLVVLSVPLMMKWHHPILVLSWNFCANPYFLPGRPSLWMLMALLSLVFGILNRSARPDVRFLNVPAITASLLFLLVVVVITAVITGGLGMRSLGSTRYGGKGYFYILAAIGGYFALTSKRIPAGRVPLYIGMFFLSALTALISNLVYTAGPSLWFLYYIFPPEEAMEQAMGENSLTPMIARIYGLTLASTGLYAYLMARYGIRGLFQITRPFRLVMFAAALAGCLFCGFRANLILFGVTFTIMFLLEGLHKTRFLAGIAVFFAIAALAIAPYADKLPPVVQRTLSFLPIRVDPMVSQSATSSNEWRIDMWRTILPQIPKYLLKGKGYGIDPTELFMAGESVGRSSRDTFAVSAVAGDYHNGAFSVLIPFGIFGALAFVCFLIASLKTLHGYYRDGDPAFKTVNRFLLAFFIAHIIHFLFIYGSLYEDLFIFTGLVGLSVSLNGIGTEPVKELATEQEVALEEVSAF
jgi:hypothetical protein